MVNMGRREKKIHEFGPVSFCRVGGKCGSGVLVCVCVKNMALNGGSEILGECEEKVLDPIAGSSKDFGSIASKEEEGKSENRENEELVSMREKIASLEREMQCVKEELTRRTKAKGEESPAVGRLSDWSQTQFRCLESYIDRAWRETFEGRLKFKREVEYEVRDYLFNLDGQINKLRSRVMLVEVEIWPGGGPLVREQKMALAGKGLFAKGKGWRAEWIEGDDDWIKEKAKPMETNNEEKVKPVETNNEEKVKPVETNKEEKAKPKSEENAKPVEKEKGRKEAKGSEKGRVAPYKEGDKWWAPITNEEWESWRGDETYKCKEGGRWTTMSDGVYERYKLMKEFSEIAKEGETQ